MSDYVLKYSVKCTLFLYQMTEYKLGYNMSMYSTQSRHKTSYLFSFCIYC